MVLGEDMSEAAKIIDKNNIVESGQARYLFKKKVFSNVTKELDVHWEDITLLSHLLYKKKSLEYKDIKNCLIKKSKDKKFWKEKFRIIELIHNQNGVNYTILRDLILK